LGKSAEGGAAAAENEMRQTNPIRPEPKEGQVAWGKGVMANGIGKRRWKNKANLPAGDDGGGRRAIVTPAAAGKTPVVLMGGMPMLREAFRAKQSQWGRQFQV